jgi:hypothetical protein
MADAEKIMRDLAQIAVDHPGCDAVISDAIALIETRLEPEWISVKDRLPEIPEGVTQWFDGPRVLTVWEDKFEPGVYDVYESLYTPQGTWASDEGRESNRPPAYWRPMPKFVKPEKGGASS